MYLLKSLAMETTTDVIAKLVESLKRYLGYQKTYITLDLTEKLTLLLTALIIGAVIFVIGIIAVIFIALTIAAGIKTWTGSACLAYGIIAAFFILTCAMIFLMRKPWIVDPLTRLFSNILMGPQQIDNNEEDL